ncbi:enolase C-terminal domain-like protein [Halorubrum sp. BV1]|uniref:enolase C-terminal domain-like protein n=1 Tax=Halorubrum sp. BV1 TaxID=1498500 RepID=UPI000A42C7F6|nr:enolase C-terminal domain-like protein [Halorubrum sp. BV1]
MRDILPALKREAFSSISRMANVTQRVDMPVATDERIYNDETMGYFVRKQACDIIQPDVTSYGGLQQVQHARTQW